MTASPIDIYRRQIEKELQLGNATENTHRLALKTLLQALAPKTTATNEPKRVECGAPDFAVTEKRAHGPVTIGHLEAVKRTKVPGRSSFGTLPQPSARLLS